MLRWIQVASSNTLASPAADCHAGLPAFSPPPDLYADYASFPWAPTFPLQSALSPNPKTLSPKPETRNPKP